MRSLISALCIVALGCANDTDDSPNIFPDTSSATVTDVGGGPDTGSDTSGCRSCLQAGDWYKFDSLVVTSICGDPQHGALETLKTLWAADIAKDELAIVFEVVSVGTELVIKARSAARNPSGGICLVSGTDSVLEAPQTGCGIDDSKETQITVYSGSVASPKLCAPKLPVHGIPLDKIVLRGTHTGDCSGGAGDVLSGTLSGVLAEEDLGKICSCLVGDDSLSDVGCGVPEPGYKSFDGSCDDCNGHFANLKNLLVGFGGCVFDQQHSDGRSAAGLVASFSAKRISGGPPACQ